MKSSVKARDVTQHSLQTAIQNLEIHLYPVTSVQNQENLGFSRWNWALRADSEGFYNLPWNRMEVCPYFSLNSFVFT